MKNIKHRVDKLAIQELLTRLLKFLRGTVWIRNLDLQNKFTTCLRSFERPKGTNQAVSYTTEYHTIIKGI